MFLITNRHLCTEDRYIEVIKEASYCGVEYIILREKDLSDNELENLYYYLKNVINPNCNIIINNNIEVFKEVSADGIHLSYDDYISYYDKGLLLKDKIIGVSTHSIEEVLEVKKRYANYLFLSHIYKTKCKENLEPKGIDILKEANSILKGSDITLVALGGVLPTNVENTLKYCDDIAIMSSIMTSKNIKATIKEYEIR